MCALKLSSWTRSAPHLFVKRLRCMRKMEVASKTSQTFWRNPVSILGMASDSTETELLLSFPIRFTTDIFAMVAKFTRASTSQSPARKKFEKRSRKKKKNGNVHEYIYYQCTKKSKLKCPEPCIRQEELDRQLSSLIQKFSLRQD